MPDLDFDVSEYVAPAPANFDPLPKGDYTAMIIASDVKETKAGTGRYVELTLEVSEGQFARRRIWDRLNVNNPDVETEKRARGQLKAVSDACHIAQLNSTEQLHDIPLKLSLGLDRRDPTKNQVYGYTSIKAGFEISKPAAKAAEPAKSKPWERK